MKWIVYPSPTPQLSKKRENPCTLKFFLFFLSLRVGASLLLSLFFSLSHSGLPEEVGKWRKIGRESFAIYGPILSFHTHTQSQAQEKPMRWVVLAPRDFYCVSVSLSQVSNYWLFRVSVWEARARKEKREKPFSKPEMAQFFSISSFPFPFLSLPPQSLHLLLGAKAKLRVQWCLIKWNLRGFLFL